MLPVRADALVRWRDQREAPVGVRRGRDALGAPISTDSDVFDVSSRHFTFLQAASRQSRTLTGRGLTGDIPKRYRDTAIPRYRE